MPFGSPSDEENQVLGKPYNKNNHLELHYPIPHVFLTVEKILPDEEYSYPEDFDFDGMDAFTEMSDKQTDLVARVFFTVDEAKRHVLGFKAIQIGALKHRGSYESERLDILMSLDDLIKDAQRAGGCAASSGTLTCAGCGLSLSYIKRSKSFYSLFLRTLTKCHMLAEYERVVSYSIIHRLNSTNFYITVPRPKPWCVFIEHYHSIAGVGTTKGCFFARYWL